MSSRKFKFVLGESEEFSNSRIDPALFLRLGFRAAH